MRKLPLLSLALFAASLSAQTVCLPGQPCTQPGGGGANFPSTNGIVVNTSTSAARSATLSDLTALGGNCQAGGFPTVNSDGSVAPCTTSVNSGLLMSQAASGTDTYPTIPSGSYLLTLQGGFPVVIDSLGNVTPIYGSGKFLIPQTIQTDGAALTIGTANTPSFTQYGLNRAATGFCSGCLGGLGAVDLQGNGRGVVFSSTTSFMANNYLGGFEASGYFFMGNYSGHSSAKLWLDPAGVVNSLAYTQYVRPNVTNNYTVAATDSVIPVDTNTNSINAVMTLETSPTAGHTVTFKHITSDAHTVTIQFPSGVTGTIDGASTYVLPASSLGSVTLVEQSATSWLVIGKV